MGKAFKTKPQPRHNELEDDPYHVRGQEVRELPPHQEQLLITAYNTFQEHFKPDVRVVYHPCGSNDTSPSVSFPHSRVVYVDISDAATKGLRAAGFEAHTASALEFDPGPVDVLIMLNPQISAAIPASHVVSGGYVLCNDYHGNATELKSNPDFSLVGVLQRSGNMRVVDTDALDDYWKEIETDVEFRAAPFSWGAVYYDSAKKVVEKITGQSGNVLEEYKKIVALAREQHNKWKEELMTANPNAKELTLDGELYRLQYGGHEHFIDNRIPRKKGTVDDIFVFRKR